MNLLLPSLKITGGNIEALKLIKDISAAKYKNNEVNNIYILWHQLDSINVSKSNKVFLSSWFAKRMSAPFQYPFLLIRFFIISRINSEKWIFTHYSTLLFSLLIRKNRRYYFVQDLEWKFLENRILKFFLKKFILAIYSKGNILAANNYLEASMLDYGLKVYGNVNIWADRSFLWVGSSDRTIDGIMMLRYGGYKRLDLYREFISKCSQNKNFNLAFITPEKKIFDDFKNTVKFCYLSPSILDMREIYSKSKIFIHLSDHEGFGLPPLEAMGSGCVPICRDSGGVRAYMNNFESQGLLLKKSLTVDEIIYKFNLLLNDSENLDLLSKKAVEIFSIGLERNKYKIFINSING